MTGRRSATDVSSVKSDLERVDAHVIGQDEYEDAPEWTDAMFEEANALRGGTLVRRGRPRLERPKVSINIRLSADVLEQFRSAGPGWQTRIDAALRQWLVEHGS